MSRRATIKRAVMTLAGLLALLALTPAPPVSATGWSATGNMTDFRTGHTATLLNDGRVLVVGGPGAELYNPTTGTWSVTGSMTTPRAWHTATRLADGRVLVAGGDGAPSSVSSAEIYDPATGTWSVTGSLARGRRDHTATVLTSGQVLVAGGSVRT